MAKITHVPSRLQEDRYWKSLIHLFRNHPKLQQYFTSEYFDLASEKVRSRALKMKAKPWSRSEKFMLDLALHCYSDTNKVDLAEMDHLDSNNTRLALEAIGLRYR